MDIIGKETLENLLCNYTGTVLTVSHDRYFVNRVCNRLIVFDDGKVNVFDGGYAEYEQSKISPETDEQSFDYAPQKKKDKPVSRKQGGCKAQAQNELSREKVNATESEISKRESTLQNDESVYSDYKKITTLQEEIDALKEKLKPLEDEWIELSEKV